MHAICNPQHQVAYPDLANTDLLNVMKRCLDRDPKTRITLQVRALYEAQLVYKQLLQAAAVTF